MTHIAEKLWQVAILPAALMFILASCDGDQGDSDDGVAAVRKVSVTVARARQQEIQVELYSIGRLVSKNTPLLAAEINAPVVDVLVDEGEPVEQGQVLIRLDTTTSMLARREAQAEIQRLKASIANEERRVTRYRDLKTKDVMPQERLDDAEAKLAVDRASMSAAEARMAIAEDRLSKAELVSPVNGVVEKRHVSIGDYVKVGTPMVTVTDTQTLRAHLPFPETVGHQLELGHSMSLESPIAPGQSVAATSDQIRPQIGAMSRALIVISEVTNPGFWRPEATVEASAVVERRHNAVTVPVNAVVRRPAGDVVYVLDDPAGQLVRQQQVVPGARQNGWIEVREGLRAGEIVAVDGAHYLSDGAEVVVREGQK
jgi:RND family efflux transporter MFP subunit